MMSRISYNQPLKTSPWFTLNFLTTTDYKVSIMEKEKKELLKQQIEKLNEVLLALDANFDIENEISDEYSFLSIAKQQLEAFAES